MDLVGNNTTRGDIKAQKSVGMFIMSSLKVDGYTNSYKSEYTSLTFTNSNIEDLRLKSHLEFMSVVIQDKN